MDLGIDGRTALVCGASRGLGFACAERFATAGCNLVLVSRSVDGLGAAIARLRQRHDVDIRPVAADLAEEAGRDRVIGECGSPDILLLAGGWPSRPADPLRISNGEWHEALESLLLSQIHLMSSLVPGMRARGFGRIVAVTSRLIKQPEFDLVLPSTARLGLTAYVKSLSNEVAADGVTVNTVLPGIFMTETQAAHSASLERQEQVSSEEIHGRRVSLTPARRFGRPDEFSSLCAYLCSADAGFITGQAVTIDGGAHAGVW